MKYFPLDKNYGRLLESHGISLKDVLKNAKLPLDLFQKKNPCINGEEYFRFMQAIDDLITDKSLPIQLAISDHIEMISPPLFAGYCSANGEECIKRIAQYKALVGSLSFHIQEDNTTLSIQLYADQEIPEIVVGIEFVLLTNLFRKATNQQIKPLHVYTTKKFSNTKYEAFLNVKAEIGNTNKIVFSMQDMEISFITHNDSILDYFEPELKKRLNEMEKDDSFSGKVRNILVSFLPAGKTSIEDVSKELHISKRSLQRKLKEESTTFQKQLNHVRELLAKNYLQNTNLSSEDIAYLLGFQDLNSFYRAFLMWTGKTITEYKQNEL